MSLRGPGVFERVFKKKKSERERNPSKNFPACFSPRAINWRGRGTSPWQPVTDTPKIKKNYYF